MGNSINTYLSLVSQGYGLALFVLGAIVWVLPRQDTNLVFAPHLGWLAAFGILHGLLQFLNTARLSIATVGLISPENLLLASSFLALLEFGRRSWNDTKSFPKLPFVPVYGVVVAGVGGFMLAAIVPFDGLDAGIRFMVGAPGAMISSFTLIATRRVKLRGESTVRHVLWLWISALGLAFYALLTLFVPRDNPGALPWIPTEADFDAFTGLPVQLGRALCAGMVATGFAMMTRHAYHLKVDERIRDLKQAQDEVILLIGTLNGYVYRDVVSEISNIGLETEEPVYITGGVEKLTGYSADEFVGKKGKTFPDIIFPEDTEIVWKKIKEAVSAHREFEVNYRIVTHDGEVRWVYERGHGVYDEAGKAVFVEGYVIDDHERKLAEQLMLDTSAMNDRIIKEAPIGMSIYNFTGQCIVTNSAYAKMAGGTQKQTLQQNYNDLESWKKSGLLDAANRSIDQNQKLRGEFELVTTFGKHASYDVNFMPFVSNGQQHLLIMIDEITERRRTETELDKYRHQLEQLVDERTRELKRAQDETELVVGTLKGYFYRDIVEEVSTMGIDPSISVYMTEGIEKLSGYSTEELTGKDGGIIFSDLIHPDDKEKAWAVTKEAVSANQEFEISYRILTRDDEERWVYESGHGVYDENGKAIYIEGYVIDDHERKKAEAEIENQNAELERFTYTVSHDLKSPLVTIKGFIGLLSRDLAGNNAERIAHDIDMISKATDTMGGLLNDLLELSRAGQVIGEPVTCNLAKIADQVIELMETRIDALSIDIVVDELPDVIGDEQRLVEVYQNLIENAIKFMGAQQAPQIHIGATEEDAIVECFVRDNGVGIAPEHLHRVFDLFERLGTDTEGTGIGLALVKRIIEMHGGQIGIESEGLGHGSTVLFTLPVSSC